MALTTCPECEGKVSTEAQACPHCGMPGPFGAEEPKDEPQQRPEPKPEPAAAESAPDSTQRPAEDHVEHEDPVVAARAAKKTELASLRYKLAMLAADDDDFRVEMERQRLVSRIDKITRELEDGRFDDAAQRKACPHCGELSLPDVDFCEGCGEALTGEPIRVPRPVPESQIDDDWATTPPSRENLPWIVGGAVFAVVVLVALCSGIISSVGGTASSEMAAQGAVLARLKAPSTAEFVSTEKFGEGTYFVVVDAQNSFGAPIRGRFCVVLPESGQSEQVFECTREEAVAIFE